MAYQQVAQLYLRGSLINKTLKNLLPDQRNEIERIIEVVMTDPSLQQCRREFSNALARTIRNEYEDRDVGEQDLRIAIMRAAVAAKYGDKPALDALTDPIQRKKWFQTWIFNYLRQILRENKLPYIKRSEKVELPADTAAIIAVCNVIEKLIKDLVDPQLRRNLKNAYNKLTIHETDDGYQVNFDHWSFPEDITNMINNLITEYEKYKICISHDVGGIKIQRLNDVVPIVKIMKKSERLVRVTSFDDWNTGNDDNDDHREDLEAEASMTHTNTSETMEETEVIDRLRNRIPNAAKPVFDIMLEDTRPPEYVQKYGISPPKISHIAEYLGISQKEVKRLRSSIKAHGLAIGIGR